MQRIVLETDPRDVPDLWQGCMARADVDTLIALYHPGASINVCGHLRVDLEAARARLPRLLDKFQGASWRRPQRIRFADDGMHFHTVLEHGSHAYVLTHRMQYAGGRIRSHDIDIDDDPTDP